MTVRVTFLRQYLCENMRGGKCVYNDVTFEFVMVKLHDNKR